MRIDIAEMSNNSDSNVTVYGQFTINGEYTMICACEGFYTFLGSNSYYKLPELIHPDDVDEFLSATQELKDRPQTVLVRIRNISDEYELFLLEMELNTKGAMDDIYIDVSYANVLYMKTRTMELEGDTKKYNKLLSFDRRKYFEYDSETEKLKIFMYVNDRLLILFDEKVDEWYRKASPRVGETDRMNLESLYYNIKNGVNDFHMNMSCNAFYETDQDEVTMVKGSVIYVANIRKYVVGTIMPKNSEKAETNQQYYVSELRRDAATGLYNKKAVAEYVQNQIDAKTKQSIYYVVMDIDDFKRINDTYGHMFGDAVIQKLAEILQTAVNGRGIAGRFGGDEFVMVLENMELQELRTTLKTVCKNFTWAFKNTEQKLDITLSMGISRYPEQAKSYRELFLVADKCVYIAKEKGKNRFIVYTPEKHGDFVFADENTVRGGKTIVSYQSKASALSEIIYDVMINKSANMDMHMESLKEYLAIDAVTIGVGEHLKTVYNYGEGSENISYFDEIVEPEYYTMFDDGVFSYNNPHIVQRDFPQASDSFVNLRMGNSIQCYYEEQGKRVLVNFYSFVSGNKRSSTDISLLVTLGKILCKEYAKK